MFHIKRLTGKWSTDTLDGRTRSLDVNHYAQVFASKQCFAKIYPMDSKGKDGDPLKVLCGEFIVPDNFTFDGLKEQGEENTDFMKHICKHNIDYYVIKLKFYQ